MSKTQIRELGDSQTFIAQEYNMNLSRVEWMKKLAYSNGCKDPMGVLDEMMREGVWPSACRISEESQTFYWLDVVASDYMRLNALYNLISNEITAKGNPSLTNDLISGSDVVPARDGVLKLCGFARSAPYDIALQIIKELDLNYENNPENADRIFESRLGNLTELIPGHDSLSSIRDAYLKNNSA